MFGSQVGWINKTGVDQGVLGGACKPIVLVTVKVVVASFGIGGVKMDAGVGGFGMLHVGVALELETDGGTGVCRV